MYIYFKLSRRFLRILGLGLIVLAGLFCEQKIAATLTNVAQPLEQVKTEEKALALTINVDWGEEFIPGILDILEQGKAKATFFVTGRWAKKNPELLKEISRRGHQIENHGYSHPHPDNLSVTANMEEIKKTEEVVFNTLGSKTKFYAPPYGERGMPGLRAADQLGYRTIMWTYDTVDWRPDSTTEVITKRILNPPTRFGIKPRHEGAIVLMHPKANTVKAMPIIIKELTRQGFKLVTINELITLERVGNTTS